MLTYTIQSESSNSDCLHPGKGENLWLHSLRNGHLCSLNLVLKTWRIPGLQHKLEG